MQILTFSPKRATPPKRVSAPHGRTQPAHTRTGSDVREGERRGRGKMGERDGKAAVWVHVLVLVCGEQKEE